MAKKRTEQIDLNINAITSKALSNIDDVTRKFENLDKIMDKVASKGDINGNNVSGKDSMRVAKGTEDLQKGIQSINEMMHELNNTRNGINRGRIQGSGKDVEALTETIKQLTTAMSRVYTRGGYDGQTIDTTVNARAKKIQGLKINPDRGIANQGRDDYDLAREKLRERRMKQTAGHNYDAPLNKIADANDRFAGKGYASYYDYKNTQSYIGTTQSRIKGSLAETRGNISSMRAKESTLTSQKEALNKDSESNPDNLRANNQKIQAIEKEITSTKNLLASLDEFKSRLESASQAIDQQKTTLDSNVKSGSVEVGVDPNSFKGKLKRRELALGMSAVASAGATAKSWADQGAQSRQNMESTTMGIAMNNSVNGGSTKGATNDIESSLNRMGIKNGSNYTGEDISTLASAYTSSTGKTSDSMSATNSASKFARFSGAGLDATASLVSNLGNTGAIKSSSELKGLETAIQSGINNSHMTAKATEQVAGLNSILGNLQGQNLSTKEVSNISGFQASMAKYGANMQGEQGASSYNALAGMAKNGFNDPTTRLLAGGNSQKYAGIHGQAELYKKMSEGGKDPEFLMNMVKNVTAHANNDSTVASADLSQRTGMTYSQASHYVEASKDGSLSPEKIKKIQKEDKSKNKKAEDTYKNSGVATLDQKQAQLAKDTAKLSQSFDHLRKVTNGIKANSPTGANFMASMGGSIVGSVGGAVLTAGGKKVIGKGITKFATSKFGTKIASKTGGNFIGKFLTKRATSGVAKAGAKSGISKMADKTLGGLAEKVGFKSIAKVAGKGGSKSIPILGTALGVGWDIKDSFSKDKKTANSGKGGLIGSSIGGVIGGVAGSIIPGAGTAAGAVLGSSIGGVAGNFIGGMIKPKTKKQKEAISESKERKKAKVSEENKKLVKDYNKMLDKALKVIARGKSGSSGKNFNLSGSLNSGSSSDSDGTTEVDDSKESKEKKSKSSLPLQNKLGAMSAPVSKGSVNMSPMTANLSVTVNANNIDKTAEELGAQVTNGLRNGMERANNDFYSKSLA